MKLLFLTIAGIQSVEDRGIYTDLLRCFRDNGHEVFIVTPVERRTGKVTRVFQEEGATVLQVRTLNLQKTNVVEKGIGTLAIEYQYLKAIKKHFNSLRFDLVLYSTPPITFEKVIKYIKARDGALSYLLLKDIFPQNAVDLGMMRKDGLLHRFFTSKEKSLYRISDYIGCMSPANLQYLIRHNNFLCTDKIEENPNSIEPAINSISEEQKVAIRRKYNLPLDQTIFVYGGNLGLPQGIDFLLETIERTRRSDVYFLVVGSGTEYDRMASRLQQDKVQNVTLLKSLPKTDYDLLLPACDIGMIFLDKRFTIPNFPSRLLSYLEFRLPVLAATDANTDVGKIVEEAGCGFSVLSGDQEGMQVVIHKMMESDREVMKQKAWNLLQNRYLVQRSYHLILSKLAHV